MNKQKEMVKHLSEDEDEIEVPDEFSDEDFDQEENEYGEHEERFEPRESISSRGGLNKFGTLSQKKDTSVYQANSEIKPEVAKYENQRVKEVHKEVINNINGGESGESSVIVDIVEEKIVNVESDTGSNNNAVDYAEQRNQQINEYLDIDQEAYLNKNEYDAHEGEYDFEQTNQEPIDANQASPYAEQENEGEEEVLRNAGLQTIFVEDECKHILYYAPEGFEPERLEVEIDDPLIIGNNNNQLKEFGNSPIQEKDDEQYSTPNMEQMLEDGQIDERLQLYQIANEVKKKDQSRKFVLWEVDEMRNKWDDKVYGLNSRQLSQK